MNNSYFLNNKIFYKNLIISFSILSFLFLFDLKYEFFQFRFFILLPIIFIIIKLLKNIDNFDFKAIKITFLLAIFIFLHLYLNIFFSKQYLSFHNLFSFIFLVLIFYLSFYYSSFFLENKNQIILLFFILFIASSIISFFNYQYDAPYLCGGVKNNFFDINKYINAAGKWAYLTDDSGLGNKIKDFNLSYREFIFPENSHLGMIAVPLIIYSIYFFFKNEKNYFFKSLSIVFIILCLIKSSTTLLVGLSLSLIILLISEHKRLNPKVAVTYFLFLTFVLITFFSNYQCRYRLIPQYGEEHFVNKELNKDAKKMIQVGNITKGGLSGGVYYFNLKITYYSIMQKPLGFGLNRYEEAFNNYIEKNTVGNAHLKTLNKKDGSNNFNKLITEFGIFGIFIYIFFIFYTFSKKIPIEEKLFLLPLLITQSLRGAGYFNGGFALVAFIVIISYLRRLKKI